LGGKTNWLGFPQGENPFQFGELSFPFGPKI